MQAPRRTPAREDGFTLVEVLIAATLLVVGVLGLLTMLDTANAATATVRAREGATTLARQVTEAARSVPYGALAPRTIEAELQAQPGLASRQGAGTAWTLERRGFLYAVSATVCSVDDPADGTGVRDAGLACTDGAAAGTDDRNPDDYKRIRVEVRWTSGSATRSVRQVALINNPGSDSGPAVTDVALTSPAGSPITSEIGSASLTATTSSPASSVAWSVDGVVQGSATGNSTGWTFTWPTSQLVDGAYLVTAQAFDQAGASGAMRSLTITLNRRVAPAPRGVAGGRNGTVVDLEWLPSPERDVVGYRVFRVSDAGGQDVLACALTRATTCQDTSPPPGTLSYVVVADDLDPAGDHRDGLRSDPVTVTTTNVTPGPPSGLSATAGGGVTTLTWQAPTVDADDIAFYRVYRDGTAFADRYDRTGSGTELSYIDNRADGDRHQYWVTAVDAQLAESAPIGPVSG